MVPFDGINFRKNITPYPCCPYWHVVTLETFSRRFLYIAIISYAEYCRNIRVFAFSLRRLHSRGLIRICSLNAGVVFYIHYWADIVSFL